MSDLANVAPSGIVGLDLGLGGGFPRQRASLLAGGPGCGKTVLGVQTLVYGALHFDEPGLMISCEESREKLIANAASFSWDLPALEADKRLAIVEASPPLDVLRSGQFTLEGLIALVQSRAENLGARRIVIDSLDAVLWLMGLDGAKEELYRLVRWVDRQDYTVLLTTKRPLVESSSSLLQLGYECLEYAADCVLELQQDVVRGITERNLFISKNRGRSTPTRALPFLITGKGLQVAYRESRRPASDEPVDAASVERVSSGVPQLDEMLGGGYYRNSGTLITGAPGTAKTSLAAAFIGAACERGEPSLILSFDSSAATMLRNLRSIGIELGPFQEDGTLVILDADRSERNPESHFLELVEAVEAQGTRCLAVDPVSAFTSESGNKDIARELVTRLVSWAEHEDVTLLCTSLLGNHGPLEEGSAAHVSTVADTWLHLTYQSQAGERNRAITIVKSRGTAHSNQTRELLLSDDGISLAEVYSAGGEVLMGTLRWEAEERERRQQAQQREAREEELRKIDREHEDLELALRRVQDQLRELENRRKSLEQRHEASERRQDDTTRAIRKMRLRKSDSEDEEGPDG